MRKNTFLVSFLLILTIFAGAQTIDSPVALVNLHKNEPVSLKKFSQQITLLENQRGTSYSLEEKKQLLDLVIEDTLINQAAENLNIRVVDAEIDAGIQQYIQMAFGQNMPMTQFEFLLKNEGSSLKDFREKMEEQLIREKYIMEAQRTKFENVPLPSEEQIMELYTLYRTSFVRPETKRFSHIFINTLNISDAEKNKALGKAETIYQELKQKGIDSFSELALKYSDDPKTKFKGGDFGYIEENDPTRRAEYGRTFIDKLFVLKTGEISNVLQSNQGYHIVRITESYQMTFLELDDIAKMGQPVTVKEFIISNLNAQEQQKIYEEAYNELVAGLRAKADITVFEDKLNW
jgi:peptidyl-prolyl cis-trans isomerase SurA